MSLRVIELQEYKPEIVPKDDLAEDVVKSLHALYARQVDVETPSFLNNNSWCLKSKGWVGYIPLSDDVHFSLVPKVPIRNLFGMLEYAYRLKGFKILEGLVDSASIAELYDRLALVLAKRVLDRVRRGLYRSYIGEDENLPYVKGRLDVLAHMRDPARVTLPCHYDEHTADLDDNQILLWTLTRVLKSGICTDRSLPYIRQARRILQGLAIPFHFTAQNCVGRLYNRLNDDYEPMHALCRFFLEHTGPTHSVGDRRMLPILVDMERLFELFVVEWLKLHVPDQYIVREQADVHFAMGQTVSINIDITLEDVSTGKTVLVLDTKYKAPDRPAPADIEQVVAYAAAKCSRRAALVYPARLAGPIAGRWGPDIYVESLAFCLDGNIEECGKRFLAQLLHEEQLPEKKLV